MKRNLYFLILLPFLILASTIIAAVIAADNSRMPVAGGGVDTWRTKEDAAGIKTLVVKKDPDDAWTFASAASGIVNTTTAVTLKTAAATGVRNYVQSIQVAHATLGAATELAIRDGAGGTVLWRTVLHTTALPTTTVVFDKPLRGSTATLLEVVTLTAVTGGVYVNAQGYFGP
jgi:hypothetical protein